MASTYVNDLRLEEIATGEQSGTWGDTTNTNLELIAEAFSFGTEAITTNADTHTTTIADGATDPGRSMFLKYTGTLDSACTITIAPNTVSKLWFIENGTSGSQNILISQGSGANITIPPGDTKAIYSDGAGSGAAMVDAFASLSVVDLKVQDDLTVTDDMTVGGTLGVTGVLTATSLDISGDIDVDGTTNLDAVDIDGAVNIAATTTIASTNKILFNDASQFIQGSSATVLSIAATDEIDLTATAIDLNGTLDVSGTALVTGVLTTTAATVFNGGFAANEISTITDATSFSAGLSIINTADTHGSVIDFFNNSSTPADNDYIGGLIFKETNSAGGTHSYAKIFSQALDVTDGTEDGSLSFETSAAGANTAEIMRINNTGVGLFTTSPDTKLQITGDRDAILRFENTRTTESANQILGSLEFYSNDASGTGANVRSRINAFTFGGGNESYLTFSTANGTTDDVEVLRLDKDGNVIIASTGGTLQTATAGTSNFRAGVNAGDAIASGGNYNVCVGDEAGTAITTADSNVAVGYQALAAEDTLSESVAVGYQALANQNADDANGGKNTAVGFTAGAAITTGNRNTFVGNRAGLVVDTADGNVAVGYDALFSNTGGESNTAIGFEALRTADANSGFIGNVAVGIQAGKAITDGVYNTVIGSQAGLALASVNYNTVVGAFALDACSHGSQTTAIGYGALTTQDYGTTTTTSFNTAVGYLAAAALSTGQSCTVMGNSAGQHISSGSGNTFLGSAAGTGVSGTPITGSNNTAVGTNSGNNLRGAAHSNSFLGYRSGLSVTTGSENTYMGFEAGDATQTAISNTAVGYLALSAAANSGNTAIGRQSLKVVTGSNNTGLGKDSGLDIVGGSNNICLGHDAGRSSSPGGSITSGNNTITIGDNSIATANVKVDWTIPSDQRDKTDFTALDIGLDFVKALNPVTYKWDQRSDYGDPTEDDWSLSDQTPDGTHKKDWLDLGFKAQEVEALEIAAGYNKANKTNLTVSLNPDGEQYGMKYSKFIPILVKAIQEQNALIEALTARVATLEG